jgi:hypothetical protein
VTFGAVGRGKSAGGLADLAIAGVIAGLALLAAALHAVMPFNHDAAYFIDLAGRLLDGGRFGRDIMDINPPHVWWISAVPVWLARQVGMRLEIATTAFTALLAVVSLVAVDRLIASNGSGEPTRRAFVPIAAILVLFVPGYDFSQREHWMILLTLPYVVARSVRVAGAAPPTASAILIGVAACLGFCIKPYYLLVPVALEIWQLVRTRRPRLLFCPETIALGVTGVIYAGLTLIFARSYLEVEVPSALLGYWSYKSPMLEVLGSAVVQLAPAAVLASFAALTRKSGERIHPLAQAFAVVGAATLVAAVIQMKPWPYHFLPSNVFFGLSVLIFLLSGTPRAGTQALRHAAVAILIVLGFSFSVVPAIPSAEGNGTARRVDELAAVFRANPGTNRTVFGFITSPRDIFPAVLAARMTWAAPFCCGYLIAAGVRADEAPAADRAAIRRAGQEQAEMAVAAARAMEPGIIVIATGEDMLGFNGRNFDYLDWLGVHTDFMSVLARYREISPIGTFRVFVKK